MNLEPKLLGGGRRAWGSQREQQQQQQWGRGAERRRSSRRGRRAEAAHARRGAGRPGWVGSGSEGEGDAGQAGRTARTQERGSHCQCKPAPPAALKGALFWPRAQSGFYLLGGCVTHQCRGPLGGLNWPGRSPRGRGRRRLQSQRPGCGPGRASRGCSQPEPCRTPWGKLRSRVEAWPILSTPPEPHTPDTGPGPPFLLSWNPNPSLPSFLPSGKDYVCHFTGGGTAFPLMEKVRWAGALGRPSTRRRCL